MAGISIDHSTLTVYCSCSYANKYKYGWGHEFNPTTCWICFSVNTQKDVVGITRHVVTTISAFSFTMLLLDRILTHIVNHLSNTSYHFQYLYYPGGNETGAKPNLITCITEFFLSGHWFHCFTESIPCEKSIPSWNWFLKTSILCEGIEVFPESNDFIFLHPILFGWSLSVPAKYFWQQFFGHYFAMTPILWLMKPERSRVWTQRDVMS